MFGDYTKAEKIYVSVKVCPEDEVATKGVR